MSYRRRLRRLHVSTRTARCACGRVEATVQDEPLLVVLCHCDFCQKRSGNVFIASAHFAEEQVVAISGETKIYNGLEVDGVGAVGVPGGIDYHFCTTCGSTLYWVMVSPLTGQRIVVVAVGNFVDADFPIPTTELFTKYRHTWVAPVPDAAQVHDPLDGSVSLESMVPSFRQDSTAD
jgi:hypothetical protein